MKKEKYDHEVIVLDDKVISGAVTQEFFACDIAKCKGACCVEGEVGAPLEEEELAILEDIYEQVAPYLSKAGRRTIQESGKYVYEEEDGYATPLINGLECAYTVFDDQGIAHCGIEKAYQDRKIDFRKPISCHLYPIRITETQHIEALNYDRWDICTPACPAGKSRNVKVYEFAREAIIRKYGEEFYQALDMLVKQREEERNIQ